MHSTNKARRILIALVGGALLLPLGACRETLQLSGSSDPDAVYALYPTDPDDPENRNQYFRGGFVELWSLVGEDDSSNSYTGSWSIQTILSTPETRRPDLDDPAPPCPFIDPGVSPARYSDCIIVQDRIIWTNGTTTTTNSVDCYYFIQSVDRQLQECVFLEQLRAARPVEPITITKFANIGESGDIWTLATSPNGDDPIDTLSWELDETPLTDPSDPTYVPPPECVNVTTPCARDIFLTTTGDAGQPPDRTTTAAYDIDTAGVRYRLTMQWVEGGVTINFIGTKS